MMCIRIILVIKYLSQRKDESSGNQIALIQKSKWTCSLSLFIASVWACYTIYTVVHMDPLPESNNVEIAVVATFPLCILTYIMIIWIIRNYREATRRSDQSRKKCAQNDDLMTLCTTNMSSVIKLNPGAPHVLFSWLQKINVRLAG